ncbi:hypothetical protein HMPREF2937_03665 [Staphylococcus sp. HMSC061G12]|nr:hypothetical protein HMPREF2846_01120 [Staphylococcus sp. HMSC056G08]OHR52959.1 hypothetical protein HMPREF2937_03665 [Staphylococcus sp. HMSC061G12]
MMREFLINLPTKKREESSFLIIIMKKKHILVKEFESIIDYFFTNPEDEAWFEIEQITANDTIASRLDESADNTFDYTT